MAVVASGRKLCHHSEGAGGHPTFFWIQDQMIEGSHCMLRPPWQARTHAHTHTATRTCSHACGTKSKIHKHDVNTPACALVWIYTDGRAGGGMDGWMDGWMDGCMDGCMQSFMHAHMHPCIQVCGYGQVRKNLNVYIGRERERARTRDPAISSSSPHTISHNMYVCGRVALGWVGP